MKLLKPLALSLVSLLAIGTVVITVQSLRTEREIAAFRDQVAQRAKLAAVPARTVSEQAPLPPPVKRYFDYVFRDGVADYRLVRLSQEGQFRRPLTEGFMPTTAEQVIAVGEPALMFSATTPIIPGVWARAYDFFADGKMQMKARIMSSLTVVDEHESAVLNEISLRRWLLESSLYPIALLPGGPVRWEAVDETRARAIVERDGLRASLMAHFASDGRMIRMTAESDGDLTTPYHGSGEAVERSDYRLIQGQMIPMGFTISRAAEDKTYPFWTGRVVSIAFE